MRNALKVSGIALSVALLATLPAAALDVNIGGGNGGVLGGGGSNGSANATVNTNLLNDNGDDATARINLGNGLLGSDSDPTTADVNLFGGSNQQTTGNVRLGNGADGTNGDVLLDLFGNGAGSGDGTSARVAIGNGGLGTGGAGGGNDAALDLFGPDDGSGNGGGAPGDDGSGGNGGGGNGMPGSARTVGTVQIAAASPAAAGGKCFSPTAEQEAKLVARHDYSQSAASWSDVSELKVIDVGLCSTAGASIAAQSNISQLQSYVSAHPEIRAGLDKLGRSPGEVIAGDKAGGTLTLYVM